VEVQLGRREPGVGDGVDLGAEFELDLLEPGPAQQSRASGGRRGEQFTRGVLLQLRRVREGDQLEEDHMRNRQLVVNWLRCHTGAIEARRRDGKTYFVVIDVDAFHAGVGRLLAEVQRIKGEGDYAAARALVESYGVHFDPVLRDEIVARVEALRLPSYSAFVMPRLSPVMGQDGSIVDVDVSYPCDLESQMLEYSAMTRA